MTQNNLAVAIFKSHAEAESAVKELQRAGIEMHQLSIIGRDYHTDEHVVGYYNTGDRMKYWGRQGDSWGGISGWLFGSALFFIPEVGTLLFVGPVRGRIVGALEGEAIVGGISALGAGLYSMGIPKNSSVQYETALKSNKFIVIVQSSSTEVARAREIISAANPDSIEGHKSPALPEQAVLVAA